MLSGIEGLSWFDIGHEEAARHLESTSKGLSSKEASERLAAFGPNEIPRPKPKGALYYLGKQIKQPLIYVLLFAAALTAYLQEWIDTMVIVVVVIANAIIGYLQEKKAGEAIEGLLKYEVTNAKVKRDGSLIVLPSKELVPGDVVVLAAGDMVPAELRLMTAKDLFIDESVLTGESQPAVKQTEKLSSRTLVPADQSDMAFSGTYVVRGKGEGLVVRTGTHTEISKISSELSEAEKETFPLMEKVASGSRMLSVAVAIAAVFTFAIGLLRGYELVYMFRASVALAVALIPEGLPALLTVALAFGVQAMARRNAIVRSLPAVEALGSTTVICTDKTGTLTLNRMTVVSVWTGRREFAAEPPLYKCVMHCDFPGPLSPSKDKDLYDTLQGGVLCNDATLKDGKAHGDPTETALLFAAEGVGLEAPSTRLDEIPFETTIGYMATLDQLGDERFIFVKGAPERVLPMCTSEQVGGRKEEIEVKALIAKADEMATRALRVLAVARKEVPSSKGTISQVDASGLTFLGLVGMMDPPRPEAIDSVRACGSAGIRVVMITGDHRTTARAIGEQLGLLGHRSRVVSGDEIASMNEEEFTAAVNESDIFARTTPEHKYRIVRKLREAGEIVAVTGDGVNDAPALKAADIGVAMGLGGTDAAKSASDMVLKDDNFSTIVAAVEEGRDVYSKLQKIVAWMIPTNIGEGLMLFLAISLGVSLPLLPLQILWINLVTAIALAIPLVFEPRERGLLSRPPRSPKESLVTQLMFRRFAIVSGLMVVGTFGVFELYTGWEESIEVSRTVALNTLVFFEMVYLFSCRSLTEPAHSVSIRANMWIIVGIVLCLLSQIFVTYGPAMNVAFETASIGLVDWVLSFAIASSAFVAVELDKAIVRRSDGSRKRGPLV